MSARVSSPADFVVPEPLTFNWSASGGTLSDNQGASVTFTAPESSGKYFVNVTSNAEVLAGQAQIWVSERIEMASANLASIRARAIEKNTAQYFRISVQDTSQALVMLELESRKPIRLKLYDSSGNALAQSTSSAYFSEIGANYFRIQESISSQAIETYRTCRGSCITVEKDGNDSEFLLGVSADQDTVFDLYAYGIDYQDSYEQSGCLDSSAPSSKFAALDLEPQAITIKPKFEYVAALETLNDRDCFETSDPVSFVSLDSFPQTSLDTRADIYSLSGDLLYSLRLNSGEDSQSVNISPARAVKVIVRASDDKAAPAARSRYRLVF